jgi:hypothetical protein
MAPPDPSRQLLMLVVAQMVGFSEQRSASAICAHLAI